MLFIVLIAADFVAKGVVIAETAPKLECLGGDLASTRVANLRMHAEGQITS